MDVISPLFTDPALPRLTVYNDAGRMELSGATLGNWQSKVANHLISLGATEGSTIVIDAAAGWQPVTIAIGAWRIGVTVLDGSVTADSAPVSDGAISLDEAPIAAFTDSIEKAEQLAEEGLPGTDLPIDEVFVMSDDPFGRGVEESGGDLPFGLNDFSPELRVHSDDFFGPDLDTDSATRLLAVSGDSVDGVFTAADWAAAKNGTEKAEAGARIVCGPWTSAAGMARTLSPWASKGSVVMSTDDSAERLADLAEKENGTVAGS